MTDDKKELINQVREFLNEYVCDDETTEIIIEQWLSPYGDIYSFPYDDTEARKEVDDDEFLDYLIDDAGVPVCLVMRS